MVLGLCRCFGVEKKNAKQIGGEEEQKQQLAVRRQEAGESKKASEQAKVNDEGNKKRTPPILTHQFPFRSRPGLL
jgi:hypothetical protein